MANNRANIRAALVTMLSGQTAAGTNVFIERKARFTSSLPALIIYTSQEDATRSSIPSSRYLRTLEVKIEARIQGNNIEDSLDGLLRQVEDLISANQSIRGTVIISDLTHTELHLDTEGDQDIAIGTLTYQMKYMD